MTSVEQQIESSRARKKAIIAYSLIGVIVIGLLIIGSVFLVRTMPKASGEATNKVNTEVSTPSVTTAPVDRKALQKALSQTKQETSDLLTKAQNTNLFKQRADHLVDKLTSAYQAYGNSDYSTAQRLLTELKAEFSLLSKDYEDAYTTPYQHARTAFDQDNIDAAFELTHQALSINPTYEPAIALKKRIDVYEQVQDAYEQARVAKVENNLIKQRDAYAKIVSLDPERTDAQNALANLNSQIQASRFNEFIALANASLEQGHLDDAQRYLAQAESIKPNSSELATLKQNITTEISLNKQAKTEQNVKIFAAADEWSTVKMMSENGLKSFPNSAYLQQAKQSADRILEAQRKISTYTRSPTRLADENVRELALSTIAYYDSQRELSPKLASQLDQLSQLIEQVNQPLPVTITSDNDTYIKVLGVGIVGEVTQKVIKLKPGTYKLEGSRKGYQSKIIELVVSPSTPSITVHLVCTERV